MHSNGEHGDRRGHRGGHREDRQQRRQHRHAHGNRRRSHWRAHTRSPRTRRRRPTRTATGPAGRWPSRRGSGAHHGRQHHTDHVDGPVPTAAADVPPRLVVSPVEFEQGRRYQAGMVRACGHPVAREPRRACDQPKFARRGRKPTIDGVRRACAATKGAVGADERRSARLEEPSNGGPDDVLWPMRRAAARRRWQHDCC